MKWTGRKNFPYGFRSDDTATTVPCIFEIVNWIALYAQITSSGKGNFVVVKKGQLVTQLAHHERCPTGDHARPIDAVDR
jgi:hypothetical protein